jgi:DNA-directed RNA polymerase subunit H (RpoH/RPB5)
MDPLKHSRVPQHIILTATQSKAVLKTLGVPFEQLPGLLISDPALMSAMLNQELEFIPDDVVIKIIRNSPLGDAESIYYRRPVVL